MGRTACTEPQCMYKGWTIPLPFPFWHLFLMSSILNPTPASCSWERSGVRYRIAQRYECYGNVMGQSAMTAIGSLVLSKVRQRHTSLPALLTSWFRQMHGTCFFLFCLIFFYVTLISHVNICLRHDSRLLIWFVKLNLFLNHGESTWGIISVFFQGSLERMNRKLHS